MLRLRPPGSTLMVSLPTPCLPCGQMVQFALLIAPYMGGPAPMSAASLGTCGLPVLDWVEGVGDGPTDRFAVEGDACLEVG